MVKLVSDKGPFTFEGLFSFFSNVKKTFFAFILGLVAHKAIGQRPAYHFSDSTRWINDPNGLFFHQGLYHLYYQTNPNSTKWGAMSWGHATSKNLVNWKQHPIVLKARDSLMIYSGSALVYSPGKKPEDAKVAACFSAHYPKKEMQSMAFSEDGGFSFQEYEGNPVIDLQKSGFRDPKIFPWKSAYRMVVSLPDEHTFLFYGSKDLKKWEELSRLTVPDTFENGFECPDVFEARVEGSSEKKWVITTSVNHTQYYGIGQFDGQRFTLEQGFKRLDFGPDFFAGVTFNHAPESVSPLMIGWMSNWHYAWKIPDFGYKGSISLARQISLFKNEQGQYLVKMKAVFPAQSFKKSASGIVEHGYFEWDWPLLQKPEIILKDANGQALISAQYQKEKRQIVISRMTAAGSIADQFWNLPYAMNLDGIQSAKTLKMRWFVDGTNTELEVENGKKWASFLVLPSQFGFQLIGSKCFVFVDGSKKDGKK